MSRNFCFGRICGKTLSRQKAFKQMRGKVLEGLTAAKVLKEMAVRYKVWMPICQNIYDLLYTEKPLTEIIDSLLL